MEKGLIAAPTATLFGALSRIRGRRIFHPHGVGFEARLVPADGAPTGAKMLDHGPRDAVVRLSRSAGLPEALPDPCGLAFRVPDAGGPDRHQDVLLVTSGRRIALRHMIFPASGFASSFYSSLLPFSFGGSTTILGAVACEPAPGPDLADLASRETGGMRFAFLVAPPFGGWRGVAHLELGRRLPDSEIDDLCLDPNNSGGGLEPIGLLNRFRGPAYAGSQHGRGARRTDQHHR